MKTASASSSRGIDTVAAAEWGLDTFALVEAAGRSCAEALISTAASRFRDGIRIVALVGSGNNGADALVLVRALILTGKAEPRNVFIVLKDDAPNAPRRTPREEALKTLRRIGVAVRVWAAGESEVTVAVRVADIVVDGLSGTGIQGPLRGSAAEMAEFLDSMGADPDLRKPLIVSIDVPSGVGETWRTGMPVVSADLTLAVEPIKACLYLPDARPFAGRIVPVTGIFPEPLLRMADGPDLLDFAAAARLIPPVKSTSYKHQRGVVEIRAGSPGSVGAASLASKGAQAAGAGLVRLVVDAAIRDTLASSAGGAMVATVEEADSSHRFSPDCVLVGPGWGRSADRGAVLEALMEGGPAALVVDADAVALAAGRRFSGNAILTPHPGELAEYLGIDKSELLAYPDGFLREAAARARAVIVMKGHVTRVAAMDGRMAIIDGMVPVLAMGGSGDVLAGMTAAIAARAVRAGRSFDPFPSAVAASSLLAEAGRLAGREVGFCDPSEVARIAGRIAAAAWLGGETRGQ